jgi:hypothetical protein
MMGNPILLARRKRPQITDTNKPEKDGRKRKRGLK